MYDERSPLQGPRNNDFGYSSPYRRYNKARIVNCLTGFFLVVFTTGLILGLLFYFEEVEQIPTPSNDSLLLSSALKENDYDEDISEAFNMAYDDLEKKDEMDRNNPTIAIDSPSYKHQQVLRSEKETTNYTRKGYLINKATEHFIQKNPGAKTTVNSIKSPKWLNIKQCDENETEEDCLSNYRTIDGNCNNKKHPKSWGVAMRPFARLLPADYCDGMKEPRCAKDKSSLPSSRTVSTLLHRPEHKNDPRFTYMFAVWGQFIDHDISATALTKGVDGQFISCCTMMSHPECYSVNISTSDSYYSKYNVTCMEFVRSAPAPTCNLGPREQLNQVSSYLDGSVVYGNTYQLANSLRSFSGGKLKMFMTMDGRELLPLSTDPNDGCNRGEEIKRGRYCFMTGDGRANENLHLTSLHLIMARQHNKIAQKLSMLNPEWDDEKLYQESRKIVIAQMQYITYNEFLPQLLGNSVMEKSKLKTEGSSEYNENIDSSISNSFATATFRFAHTLLPKLMMVPENDSKPAELVELHKILFNPFQLYDPGRLDLALSSAMETDTEKLDQYFNTEVTQHLFEDDTKKKTCGLDLVTLNIQRGRDHGLPGYTKWRKYCGLGEITSFSDLKGVIDDDSINVLMANYKDVEDIDLYSGALSERPLGDAVLGPTATCLIAEQFHKIKYGDRYWFENGDSQMFTPSQLDQIKKTTLASIICENSDRLTAVHQYVMSIIDKKNNKTLCANIEKPDLTQWKETNPGEKVPGTWNTVTNNIMLQKSKNGSKASDVIKLYASTIVIGGSAFASLDSGEGVQLFDGTLPAEIHLDTLVGEAAWDVSTNVEWQGEVVGNDTLAGTFTLPTNNGSIWAGNFSVKIKYKWGGSIDIVEPHKKYNCKVMFTAFKQKLSLTSSNSLDSKSPLKGKTDTTTETCTILLSGSFYTRPFYCFLTPWWCSDEKLYYWSGGADLKITKPSPNITVGALQSHGSRKKKPDNSKLEDFVYNPDYVYPTYTWVDIWGHKLQGKVSGGWMKVRDPAETIWSGELPVEIQLPVFWESEPDVNLLTNNFTHQLTWTCTFFHSNIQGNFKLPRYTKFGLIQWLSGKFNLEITPVRGGSLYDLVIPGIEYQANIHFHNKDSTAMEDIVKTYKFLTDGPQPMYTNIILLGQRMAKKFTWNGEFMVLINNIPYSYSYKSY